MSRPGVLRRCLGSANSLRGLQTARPPCGNGQSDPALSTGTTIITKMKAYVYVTLKTSVLDPQGQTIQNALRKMRFSGIEGVRQGKYFVLALAEGLTAGAARAEVERVAK